MLKLKNFKVEIEGVRLEDILEKFYIPKENSHKGQNGKLLVIGGSRLFHAASIWSAKIASYFVDIVHYSSTPENNQIFLSIKKRFIAGIVIERKDLLDYVKEDDCVLLGPGMVRGKISSERKSKLLTLSFKEIISLEREYEYTFALTHFLLKNFPNKRFVIDAGALQMMDKEWLKYLTVPAIITPHKKEFEGLLGRKFDGDFRFAVKHFANEYNCVVLLKKIEDLITDGKRIVVVEGGNPGLTKGGTGDLLAGLTSAFYTKNDPFVSSVLASFILKSSAYKLFESKGYWYNVDDIISICPEVLKEIFNVL